MNSQEFSGSVAFSLKLFWGCNAPGIRKCKLVVFCNLPLTLNFTQFVFNTMLNLRDPHTYFLLYSENFSPNQPQKRKTTGKEAGSVSSGVKMYKVLRSYSRKSERKHDATGQPPHHSVESSHYQTSNGHGGVHRDGPFVTSPPSVRNGKLK
jgi:hypothetical protein